MTILCPQCNGMIYQTITCSQCKRTMEDRGKLTDYFGPYSPYEETGALSAKLGEDPNICTHLYYCSHCDVDKRIEISKVKI